MTVEPTIEVSLMLTGIGFTPSEITARLSIIPTKTWRVGDNVGKSLMKRKQDGWMIAIRRQTYDFQKCLSELLDLIDPIQDQLHHIAKELLLEMEISCAMYISGETPSCHFSLPVIKRLACLGAAVDIDIILIAGATPYT